MSVLSKSKVRALITKDKATFKAALDKGEPIEEILIDPFDEERLGPTSYDLKLGNYYVILGGRLKPREVKERKPLKILPRQAVTVVCRECIGLPYNVAGVIFSKVTWLESGLSQISSYVHPGFGGQPYVTLVNQGERSVCLKFGEEFCQIVFFEVKDAKPDERYMGKRCWQTDKDLQRVIQFYQSGSKTDSRTLDMGLIVASILLVCAILMLQQGAWVKQIVPPVIFILIGIFGFFVYERIRQKFL